MSFLKRGFVGCGVVSVYTMAFLEVAARCCALQGKPVLNRLTLDVVLCVSWYCQEHASY